MTNQSISFRSFNEALETPTDIEPTLEKLKKELSSKYDLEVSVKKSTLGGADKTSYFFTVIGNKRTWKNGISQNSPIRIAYHIMPYEDTVEISQFGFKMKNNGIKKPSKFKLLVPENFEKKVLAFFSKFKSEISSLNEEMTDEEKSKAKKFVNAMRKDSAQDLRTRYGKRWKDVMYAIANKKAQAQGKIIDDS